MRIFQALNCTNLVFIRHYYAFKSQNPVMKHNLPKRQSEMMELRNSVILFPELWFRPSHRSVPGKKLADPEGPASLQVSR
jgi:hypothetical protein